MKECPDDFRAYNPILFDTLSVKAVLLGCCAHIPGILVYSIIIYSNLSTVLAVVVRFTTITTDVVRSNLRQDEVYSIQHYAIKSVSDLR